MEQLLTHNELPLRERTLWRMLYETAARASEVLALDVPDLDLGNRRAKVRRKGSAVDVIVWQTGTARLLPRLLAGRTTGPVFLIDRRARVALARSTSTTPRDEPGCPTVARSSCSNRPPPARSTGHGPCTSYVTLP